MEKISNSTLTIGIAAHGAELQSIQKNGKEYLWQGDARFWGRRSPVLFPNVGRVWNNQYRHNGQTYEIGQHGFARDMDFQLIHQSEDEVRYCLESTPETLAKFPFPFRLEIGYQLTDNRILVKWSVENTGKEEMPFQIGAHPAFYFPNFQPEEEHKGYFSFDQTDGLEYISPLEKGCASPERRMLTLNEEGLMPLHRHTFDCDTYIIDRHQLKKVTLLSTEKKPIVSLEFDTPLVALWSPTVAHPDCPFICIEPWYGRCDTVGYEGEWKDREWMQTVAPGETFHGTYSILIED